MHRTRLLSLALGIYAASTLVSMAVMSLGAALAAVALLLAYPGGPRALVDDLRALPREPAIRRYAWASAALVAACAISTAVAWLSPMGWGGRHVQPELGDLAKAWYFAWPLLLAAGLGRLDDPGRRRVLRFWLVALGAVSLVGIAQHFTGWPRPQTIPSSPGRYHATMFLGHHLSVASILIFPFFAVLELLQRGHPGYDRRGELDQSVLPPIALVALAALAFAALFLSYSRMLWIALPAGVALWALRALPRRQAVAAVLIVAAGAGLATRLPAVRSRIDAAIGIGDRQALWKANFEFLRLRPLTGTGFRRNIEASSYYLESLPNDGWVFSGHAHNNVIDMLGGTGMLGLAAWLGWCAVALGILWRSARAPGGGSAASPVFGWGLLCGWVVFHLNGMTQVNFWEGKVMHQMMWAVAWSLFWTARAPKGTA